MLGSIRKKRWVWNLPFLWRGRQQQGLCFCNSRLFYEGHLLAFMLLSPLSEISKSSNICCLLESFLGRWALRQDLWWGSKAEVTTRKVALRGQKNKLVLVTTKWTLTNLPPNGISSIPESLEFLICPSPITVLTFFPPEKTRNVLLYFFGLPYFLNKILLVWVIGDLKKMGSYCTHSLVTCFLGWTLHPWDFQFIWFIHLFSFIGFQFI